MKSLLKKAKKYKPVSELAIDPENNKENVWHYALSNKKNGIADYLLNANDVTLLQSHYEVEEAGIKGDRNALHILIIQEEVEKVKTLLDKIILPTERRNMIIKETPFKKYPMQRPRLMSCLHLAAYHGFNELVELFIKDMNDSDVNKVTGNKDTALMWAARLGKDDTVDTLIKNNADPNIQDDKHSTALYWAVRYGHVKTVDILLRANASPNITRTEGLVAPLIAASAYGYNDIVERLLADPNVRNKINTIKGLGGKTPLHYAAREGNIDVLNTLLKNGALLNVEDIQGNTPLLSAAQRKYNSHVVYELITRPDPDSPHGAKDLDLQRNSEGRNVWNYAIDSKDTDLLKTLVAACKNTNKDISRRQPLFIAAERGRSDMIHVLLHLQQDPLSINAKGNTFLHIAAMHDKSDVIDEFHTKVSINTPNNDKDTPLHIACGNGCDKTIKTLLKYKAKADVMNSQLETALHVAAKKNRITPDTARELVCYTKNSHTWECLNAKDSNENNCLHLAGEYAEPNVIWEFRSVRLDQNEDGHTPLHKAVRAGQPEALGMYICYSHRSMQL